MEPYSDVKKTIPTVLEPLFKEQESVCLGIPMEKLNKAEDNKDYDWTRPNDLPEKSIWTSYKTRRIAGAVFTTLGVVLAGGTMAAAIAFTASPVGVITLVSLLGITAVTASIAGIFLINLKPSLKDPEILKQRRQEAANNLKNNSCSYREILQKYDVNIVNDEGINHLVFMEIQTLSYSEFIQKRGKEIIGILDTCNKNNLGRSFFNYIVNPLNGISYKDLLKMREMEQFGFCPDNFAWEIARNEEGKSYEEFKRRNGVELLSYLSADAKILMREKFNNFVLNNNLGTIELETLYSKELELFGREIFQEIHVNQIGQFDYDTFREKNGVNSIRRICKEDSQKQMVFRNKYLALPYEKMTELKADREFLDIDDIKVKEVLTNRWNPIHILDLIKNSGFMKSLENEFRPSDWRKKTKNETKDLSAMTIASEYPQLIRFLDFQTLQTALEEEILSKNNFEQIAHENFFLSGLLSNQNIHVMRLADEYIRSRVDLFITQKQNTVCRLINDYHLIESSFFAKLQIGRKQYLEAVEMHKKTNESINASYNLALQQATDGKNLIIRQSQMKLHEFDQRIHQATETKNQSTKQFERAKEAVAEIKEKIKRLETRKLQLIGQQHRGHSRPAENLDATVRHLESQVHLLKRFETIQKEYDGLSAEVNSPIYHERLEKLKSRKNNPKVTGLVEAVSALTVDGHIKAEEDKQIRMKQLESELQRMRVSLPDQSVVEQLQDVKRKRDFQKKQKELDEEFDEVTVQLLNAPGELNRAQYALRQAQSLSFNDQKIFEVEYEAYYSANKNLLFSQQTAEREFETIQIFLAKEKDIKIANEEEVFNRKISDIYSTL